MTSVPNAYTPLNLETVRSYITNLPDMVALLGDDVGAWHVSEIGDGNLNYVYVVTGTIIEGKVNKICLKQALPYVRLVGESWPLSLRRSHFEYLALSVQGQNTPHLVPKIYHYHEDMALIIMEFLQDHVILRKALIDTPEMIPQDLGAKIGEFIAENAYRTSDFFVSADKKRDAVSEFLSNHDLCKITEDLIFDEPYYHASNNRTLPDDLQKIMDEIRQDKNLLVRVAGLKHRFLTMPQALIHGDLHTGSVMVHVDSVKIIDPEFAFYAPIGFDIGMVIANFWLNFFSHMGEGNKQAQQKMILKQAKQIWKAFKKHFSSLCEEQITGDVLGQHIPEKIKEAYLDRFFKQVRHDAFGYAATEIIRRLVGLATIADFNRLSDDVRLQAEKQAIAFAVSLLHMPQDARCMSKITQELEGMMTSR